MNQAQSLLKQVYDIHAKQNPIGPTIERNPLGGEAGDHTKTTITSALYPAGSNAIGTVLDMNKADALNMLAAATLARNNGHGEWPMMSRASRIDAMYRFVDTISGERNKVVRLLMKEICKNKVDAEAEFDRTIAYICDTIKVYENDSLFGEQTQSASGFVAHNNYVPLGVTLCVAPFNYPFNETCTTMIPALLTGNPIILKPAKHGVLFWSYLQEAMNKCFPAWVANIVTGDGPTVIGPLMESGFIDVLAFIGSEWAANNIAKSHPNQNRLEQVLGLGAKNVIVITNTADIQKYIKEIVKSVFGFNGQRCTAWKQIMVDESIYEEFVKAFVDEMEKLTIGMPTGPHFNVKDMILVNDGSGADITPLAEGQKKIDYVKNLLEDALSKGAKLVNKYGGEVYESLIIPSVLKDVKEDMRLYHEEQFAPIIGISSYKNIEEVMEYMDSSHYAQQTALYGDKNHSDMRNLRAYCNRIYARTNINSPSMRGPDVFLFAGRKNSGMKALSIEQALKVFTSVSSEVEKE